MTAIMCKTHSIKYYYRDQKRTVLTGHKTQIERIATALKLGKRKKLCRNINIRKICSCC
jgi:hypothetical protein